MKILLTGVETQNKGAELMLYAILQEIEIKHPDAIVYIPSQNISQGKDYVKTNLQIKFVPYEALERKLKLEGIFRTIHIPYSLLPSWHFLKNVDYMFDASGFAYSDQFEISYKSISLFSEKLSYLKKHNCKNIYLPQAFGPIRKQTTQTMLSLISDNASLIIPRDKISFAALQESGAVDMEKVKMFTDFTSLVDGIFPTSQEHLRNGICIIPNTQMINKGAISFKDYIDLLNRIIVRCSTSGKVVYLLNHEGGKDEKLCCRIKDEVSGNIEIVTGLNALEVKGLIASSYLVISSRFHGVASSLNSCVPCLATSWSHKYKELFGDYHLTDCILPLDDEIKALGTIDCFLDFDKNQNIRRQLEEYVPQIKKATREMWNLVWNY